MKRNILAALVLALAIPAAAFAAGTAEQPSKKHAVVAQTTQSKEAQTTQSKKETVNQNGADSTAKKSGKKARKSKKAGSRANVAPKSGNTVQPDSKVK